MEYAIQSMKLIDIIKKCRLLLQLLSKQSFTEANSHYVTPESYKKGVG